MSTMKMFFTALRIWLVFASAAIVSSFLLMICLSVFSGILASISNPFSLAMDIVIIYLLNRFGVINKIQNANIFQKIQVFYQWVGWNIQDVFKQNN